MAKPQGHKMLTQWLRFAFATLLLALLLTGTGHSEETSHVSALSIVDFQGYAFDPLDKQTIGLVQKTEFTQSNVSQNLGFKSGAIWFKFILSNQVGAENHLVFENTFLDFVEIFIQDPADERTFRNEIISRNQIQTFYSWNQYSRQQIVYLRVKNKPLLNANPKVLNTDELTKFVRSKTTVATILLTALSILFLTCVFATYFNPSGIFNIQILILSVLRILIVFILNNSPINNFIEQDISRKVFYTLFLSDKIMFYFFIANIFKYKLNFQITNAVVYAVIAPIAIAGIALINIDLKYFLYFTNFFLSTLSLSIVLLCSHVYLNLTPKSTTKNLYLFLIVFVVLAQTLVLVDINGNLFKLNFIQFTPIRMSLNLSWVVGIYIFLLSELLSYFKKKSAEIAQISTQLKSEEILRKNQENFMAMLLHELNTPLATIRIGIHTILRRGVFNDDERERGNRIDKSIDNINQIIETCVLVDKYASNEITPQNATVKLDDLIDEVIDEISERDPNSRARIALEQRPTTFSSSRISADKELLRIILNNLLNNALKYSPTYSTIWLLIDHDENSKTSTFNVKNELDSKSRPDEHRLFQKYYRSENSKKISGTGLGLWLSQTLAKKMGTHVQFNLQGENISFSIALPAVD